MPDKMKTHGVVIAEQTNRDPEFRQEWERTALARLVAAELIRYRADNKLSQRALGEKLGFKQPYVARLESGETNPEIETLVSISRATGIEFVIGITPAKKKPKLVTRAVAEQHVETRENGVSVVLAAATR